MNWQKIEVESVHFIGGRSQKTVGFCSFLANFSQQFYCRLAKRYVSEYVLTKSALIMFSIFISLSLYVGFDSLLNPKYDQEVLKLQTFQGIIKKLECPYKGAPDLYLKDSDITFRLTSNFGMNYCGSNSDSFINNIVILKAALIQGSYFQIYDMKIDNNVYLNKADIKADKNKFSYAMFALAFILFLIGIYKQQIHNKKIN